MKSAITFCLTILVVLGFPPITQSSEIQRLNVQDGCNYVENIEKDIVVVSFTATSEAYSIIKKIVSFSGLSSNFEVRSGNAPNALATIVNRKRFIVYNNNFISQVEAVTNNQWGPISILAHEVGHHLNSHLLQGGSKPDSELEADYFSGFVLQQMGATMQDAQAAMRYFGSDVGSPTHPAKDERLAAISAGWSSACDKDADCGVFSKKTEKKKSINRDSSISDYVDKYVTAGIKDRFIDTTGKRSGFKVYVHNRGNKKIKAIVTYEENIAFCSGSQIDLGNGEIRNVTLFVKPKKGISQSVTKEGDISCGSVKYINSDVSYND